MLIQPYNPEWKGQFEAIKEVLLEAIASYSQRLEHIGSTAIPGLAAKPIIDIDIVFEGEENFIQIRKGLESLGYFHNGDQGIATREVFKRPNERHSHPLLDKIPHHLYACTLDSSELKRHLLFRDYLRSHSKERDQYEALKFHIAEGAMQDRKKYAQLKEKEANAFIEAILRKA